MEQLYHYSLDFRFTLCSPLVCMPSSLPPWSLIEQYRDKYVGPKHSTLFSVRLHKDGDKWVLGTDYNAPLKGTKHVRNLSLLILPIGPLNLKLLSLFQSNLSAEKRISMFMGTRWSIQPKILPLAKRRTLAKM